MNLSLEAFTRLCAEHIRAGEPILAYRHSTGWGRLKLYPVTPEPSWQVAVTTITGAQLTLSADTPADLDRLLREARRKVARIGEIKEIPAKPVKAKAATVKAMRKAIEKMQKSRYTTVSLCSVEYDGQSVQAEGDETFVAAMQEAMGA